MTKSVKFTFHTWLILFLLYKLLNHFVNEFNYGFNWLSELFLLNCYTKNLFKLLIILWMFSERRVERNWWKENNKENFFSIFLMFLFKVGAFVIDGTDFLKTNFNGIQPEFKRNFVMFDWIIMIHDLTLEKLYKLPVKFYFESTWLKKLQFCKKHLEWEI